MQKTKGLATAVQMKIFPAPKERLLPVSELSRVSWIRNSGGAGRGRKWIGRKPINLIVGWSGLFLFFVVPLQFSQDICEWPENQILISDWTYFHCPAATLIRKWGYPWIGEHFCVF